MVYQTRSSSTATNSDNKSEVRKSKRSKVVEKEKVIKQKKQVTKPIKNANKSNKDNNSSSTQQQTSEPNEEPKLEKASTLLEAVGKFDRSRPNFFLNADNPRDEELTKLTNFVTNCIDNDKNGSLYISGLPGLGKTFTLNRYLASITNGRKMEVSYLNCVAIESKQFFKTLCTSYKVDISKDKSNGWDKFVSKVKNNRSKKMFIVLDEIDHLLVKNDKHTLDIILKLFKLAHFTNLNRGIILITVANDLNLINDKLPQLLLDRVEPEILAFAPYTQQQIQQLLTSLASDLKVETTTSSADTELKLQPLLDTKAIEFCARSVISNFQADLRKALDLIKLTIQTVYSKNGNKLKPINLMDINGVIQHFNKSRGSGPLPPINLAGSVVLLACLQLMEENIELSKTKIVEQVFQICTKNHELSQVCTIDLNAILSNLDDQNILQWELDLKIGSKSKKAIKRDPIANLNPTVNQVKAMLKLNPLLTNLVK